MAHARDVVRCSNDCPWYCNSCLDWPNRDEEPAAKIRIADGPTLDSPPSELCTDVVEKRLFKIYLFQYLVTIRFALVDGSWIVFQKSARAVGKLALNFSDDGNSNLICCFGTNI